MKIFAKPVRLTLAMFLMAIFSGNGQNAINSDSLEKSIDRIFADFDDPLKPGAAVAVVKNGEVVFKKGYGSANLEYDIPVTPNTIFHIASVSKQFTVFALLLLAEEGKLSLDDPVQKYIPEVPDFGVEITLRHLATHTSGMRDQWDLLNLAGWRWDDVITKEHILKLVAKQKELNFKPGEQFMYCNTGFTLLAEVVARVSGKSFAEFTQVHIFKPLRMANSQFYDDHTKIVRNRAYSYYPAIFGYAKSVLSYANVGATSLFTTVEDLSLWAMNFQDPKIGSRAIIEQMNTLAVLNNGKTFGGAYGQFVTPYKGLQQIQHSGGDAGYRSYFCRFPDQDFAVSVFSNFGHANPGALALQVADVYLVNEFIAEDAKGKKNEKAAHTITLKEEELKGFEGDYWEAKDLFSRKIYLKEGNLQYDRGNGNASQLTPIAKNKFKMVDVPGSITVAFLTQHGVRQMVVTQDGDVIAELEAYSPVDLNDVDIIPYLGNYFSEELSTQYTIVEQDGKLVATHPRHSDLPLGVLKTDIFSSGGTTLEFTRNDSNMIDGLNASTGRVKKLRFTKDLQK